MSADLEKAHFVSISLDASNRGSVKLMPSVVRYFQPTDGVKVKMLEVSSEKVETAQIISDLVKKTAAEWKIDDKLVAFCGDNCPIGQLGSNLAVIFNMRLMRSDVPVALFTTKLKR